MRIEWDPKALRDLKEIRDFIAADKPRAAAKIAKQIKKSVRRLSKFPMMGRQSSEPNLRILPITGTPYMAYYHILSDAIEVVAVFHGARRQSADE